MSRKPCRMSRLLPRDQISPLTLAIMSSSGVRDLIRRGDPGASGVAGVESLPLAGPSCPCISKICSSRRRNREHRVAEYVRERVRLVNIHAAAADHQGDLELIVDYREYEAANVASCPLR